MLSLKSSIPEALARENLARSWIDVRARLGAHKAGAPDLGLHVSERALNSPQPSAQPYVAPARDVATSAALVAGFSLAN